LKISRLKQAIKRPGSKVLIENFASLGVLQVLNYILPLVVLPYLTRVIGLEMYGVLAIATAVILYFQTTVDFGFDFTGTRDIAKNQQDTEALSRIFWTIIASKVLILLVAFLLLYVLILTVPFFKQYSLLLLFTFLTIPSRIIFPEWFFQGMEKMKYITLINMVSRLVFTVLIFVVINKQDDYIYYPLLLAGGNLVAGIASLWIIFRSFRIRIYIPSPRDIISAIKGSYDVFLNLLMPNLYNSFSTLLLGFWWGSAAVGIYDAANKVITLSGRLLLILSRVFFPYLTKDLDKHRHYLRISLGLSLVIMLGYLVFAGLIVRILYAPEFEAARHLIRIMAITPVMFSLMHVFGTNYLIIIKKEKILRNITMIGSAIGLMSALILIQNFAQTGAAVTLVVSRTLIGVLCLVYARRIMNSSGTVSQPVLGIKKKAFINQ
jgi:O-antigen/teichoic acid export membrane protein